MDSFNDGGVIMVGDVKETPNKHSMQTCLY